MSRALLAVLLLAPAAWAETETPAKPPRKDLVTAACGPGAPVLLVRKPRKAAKEDRDDRAPAPEAPEILDSGDGCDERVAGLSGDSELALRPDGAMTPEAVTTAFANARKVDDLAAGLTRTRTVLENAEGGSARTWLDTFFDRSTPRPDEAAIQTGLRKSLTDTLSVAANPAEANVVPLALTDPPKKAPIVGKVPDPKGPPEWYDPKLPPSEAAPILRNDNAPYTDGRGLWPFASSVGPPSSLNQTPNMNGVPAPGPHQPVTGNNQSAPIWGPFYEKFKACAKIVMKDDAASKNGADCEPYNYGIWRNSAMCHGQGKAIDVHAMKCAGTMHRALDNGRFEQMVMCMKQAGMKTIWKQCFINCGNFNVTTHHYDHAHFSVGCPPPFRW